MSTWRVQGEVTYPFVLDVNADDALQAVRAARKTMVAHHPEAHITVSIHRRELLDTDEIDLHALIDFAKVQWANARCERSRRRWKDAIDVLEEETHARADGRDERP